MKILRIIARLNVGGPARHVVWLTRNLSTGGFESRLIAGSVPDGEEDMSYFAAEHDVTPILIDEMSRELSPNDVVSLIKIYREIALYKPDIVHTHTAKAGTVGRIAAFVYKWMTFGTLVGRPRAIRVIHTFHGHVFHSYYGGFKTGLFLAIEKLLARFATDRIVVISQGQLDEISGQFGVGRPQQFKIIPLGLDLSSFSNGAAERSKVRQELRIGPDEFVVGFTGRLTEIKDLPLMLDAARESPACRFLIVGDGSLRGELEQNAPSNVSFLGNRHDVADILAAFDIIALSSKNEGTPLSLIEAMAVGIPFVSTDVGGVKDLAGDVAEAHDRFDICDRGILVRDRDARSLAAGIAALAGDVDLRLKLAATGRDFVRKRYSVERLTQDIVSLYEDLASGRSR